MFTRPAGLLLALIITTTGCDRTPLETAVYQPPAVPAAPDDGDLRIAALDYAVGDLNDPAVLAKYTRADIVVFLAEEFWGRESLEGRMAVLRAAKPDLKVLAYFRSKVIREEWVNATEGNQAYLRDLYQAGLPYLSYTTTGDTLTDWPGAVVLDVLDPAARSALIDVFAHWQATSSNRFDGVFWDYFPTQLWIAPTVDNMTGDPDLDGDGVPHWEDADELQAFLASQDAMVREMQRAMGPGFIQIANGNRAAKDSTFAGLLDGMFYEIFPEVGFVGAEKFRQALDPERYNNLFAARSWPRETNGGPWLILSHAPRVGNYLNEDGQWEPVNTGDLNRAVALLTDATAIHYDGSGAHRAGVPDVELDLGRPLGGVTVVGDRYERQFERGQVVVEMGTGAYPLPFSYWVHERGHMVDAMVYAE